MGLEIISVGSVSPWYSKVSPPVQRGLEGWFCFDTDINRLAFNRVIGKPNAFIVGAPVVVANSARFKGGVNYLQTAIADTDEKTIIALCKVVGAPTSTADGVMVAGHYSGNAISPGFTGPSVGTNLYCSLSSRFSSSAARDNGTGGANTVGASLENGTPPASWAIRSMRAKTGAETKISDHTANVSSLGASSNQRVIASSLLRIGSATANFSGEVDISAVVIASAFWSDEEIAATVELMRKRAMRLGISA